MSSETDKITKLSDLTVETLENAKKGGYYLTVSETGDNKDAVLVDLATIGRLLQVFNALGAKNQESFKTKLTEYSGLVSLVRIAWKI